MYDFPAGPLGGWLHQGQAHTLQCVLPLSFVASEAILKCSRWQIFWQGFSNSFSNSQRSYSCSADDMVAAPCATKNSNGYSPFTLYDLSAENQDFPAIRRRPPPQMSMFDPVCVSYETKPLLSCKTPCHNFCITVPYTGIAKAPACNQRFYTHLSVRGTDNPSPGISPGFAFRYAVEWVHIREKRSVIRASFFLSPQ